MTDATNPNLRVRGLIVDLARELPPHVMNTLVSRLQSRDGTRNIDQLGATTAIREKLRALADHLDQSTSLDARSAAAALMSASDTLAAIQAEYRTQIAWTGPGTEAVPLRRVDQVIYELVERSNEDVLFVTYAAYKADRALKTLRQAADRGVRIRLVIEVAKESGGTIAFDGVQVIRSAVPAAQLFYWPPERRKQIGGTVYGAMHAKCVVADKKHAIVSSANLTDHALEANMELGLVVDGPVACRLAEHFDQLILRGELVELK